MKAKDNAQNGAKKGDRTSREKLITAIVALLVIVGVGIYSRLPISTGEPFKIAAGNAVLDPRTSQGKDFFDNGFEVKEFKPMDQGDVLEPDDKIGTKQAVVTCTIRLDGVKMGTAVFSRTSKYGTAAGKCSVKSITIYSNDENKDMVYVEGIEEEAVRLSELTMERLTAALGQYTDATEGLGSNDVMDYTWKRKHYSLTVSFNADDTLSGVKVAYK